MSEEFCVCEEWANLNTSYPDLFTKDDTYGWILRWIELTKDKGFTKIHKYGVSIYFCPMCGKKLLDI